MSQRAPTARPDDPVARSIEAAPFDDEPESPEEARAVALAREQVKRGEVFTDEELQHRLGIPAGHNVLTAEEFAQELRLVDDQLREAGVMPDDPDAIAFEGTAEEAIRFLEGEHAEETIAALRAEGLLCDSSG